MLSTSLLYIRFKQITREFQSLGLRTIFVVGMFLFLIYASFKIYNTEYATIIPVVLVLIAISIQVSRSDIGFVLRHISNPYIQMYCEYVLLSLSFLIPVLLTKNWFLFPLTLIALAPIPYLKSVTIQRTRFANISRLISPDDFELISGFRKNYIFFLPTYILAVALSWFMIAPLVLLLFITIKMVSLYEECESVNVLKEQLDSPSSFIIRKIIRHSKYIIILFLPVLIINCIFNSEYIILNICFILIQLILLSFAICLKYATYIPNKNLIANNMILSIAIISTIIPFMLPIPLIMCFIYFKKAKLNLIQFT